ncbi:MAG: DUF2911 domain-containing protein [Gemmatimonadetes bacterium]|nr:DUF2911 domain-containing protein [Gemmatimonadota bacterium]
MQLDNVCLEEEHSKAQPVTRGVSTSRYGRPAARGRTMVGGDVVRYSRLWRTGANEPTISSHYPRRE